MVLHSPMGISLNQYRISIGRFGGGVHRIKHLIPSFPNDKEEDWMFWGKREWARQLKSASKSRPLVSSIIGWNICMYLILMCMDVELNPGPAWADISLCHVNIRSIRNNVEKLEHISCGLTHHYDIITLSETWLNSQCTDVSLSLPGFQLPFRRDRDDNSGYGGVLAWVSDQVAAKRRHDLELPGLEALWIEIRTHNNKFLLCTVYRPPNAGSHFWDLFQESISTAKESDIRYFIITGDLNADPDSATGQIFNNFLAANHLIAHIDEPTRVTETSAKVLDQFVSNMPDFVRNIVIEPPVSTNDHCTIGLGLRFRVKRKKAYSRTIWDFKNANWTKYVDTLDSAHLDRCLISEDVNTCSEELTKVILDAAKSSVPNKIIIVRPNDKPWYTEELRTLCRAKDRLHRIAKRTSLTTDWGKFRESRNTYFEKLKATKLDFDNSKYVRLTTEGEKNSKKWWHILKSLLGQTNDADFPPLHADGQILTDNKDKATAFNKFFSSAAQLDDSNVQLPEINAAADVSLEDIVVSEQDVTDQIKALDTTKAYGPDGLSPVFLKQGISVIAPVLTRIFNLSIQKGIVPQMWQQANVLPIFKKGKKELLTNYRPVSLLSCNAKLFEKVIFKYAFNFF